MYSARLFLKGFGTNMSCRWSCASLQEGKLAVQSEARVDPAAEEAALLAELEDKALYTASIIKPIYLFRLSI